VADVLPDPVRISDCRLATAVANAGAGCSAVLKDLAALNAGNAITRELRASKPSASVR